QFSSSHNIRVWHTLAEEFDESCLIPIVDHSSGLIIPIYSHINDEVYIKHDIFAIHQLVPNEKGIFQQDNTSQSPNLNSLENLWQEVESCLCSSLNKLTSIKDLKEKVKNV
ncbi:1773_t:CDS:2, partial [Cetraspora pellucida]